MDLTGTDDLDGSEATKLSEQVDPVLTGVQTSATGCDRQVLNFDQFILVTVQTTEFDHILAAHESSTVVKSPSNRVRLLQHLLNEEVLNARRKSNLDAFFHDSLDLVRLHLIVKAEPQDFLVLDVVVVLRIILEHGSV